MSYFCPTQNDMHTRDTLASNVWYFGLNFPSLKYDTVLLFCESFWVFSLRNLTHCGSKVQVASSLIQMSIALFTS